MGKNTWIVLNPPSRLYYEFQSWCSPSRPTGWGRPEYCCFFWHSLFFSSLVLVWFEGTLTTQKPKVSERLPQIQGYFCLIHQSRSWHIPVNGILLKGLGATLIFSINGPFRATPCSCHISCRHKPWHWAFSTALFKGGLFLLSPLASVNSSLVFLSPFLSAANLWVLPAFPQLAALLSVPNISSCQDVTEQKFLEATGSLKVKHLTILHWG